MKVCVPVTGDGALGPRWGRAGRVAVAEVNGSEIRGWQEYAVGWDVLHDEGTEGSHHARVARFLREHQVEAVGAPHVGQGMVRMLASMGVRLVTGLSGDARAAAVTAAGQASP